jgi:hypothetical protein
MLRKNNREAMTDYEAAIRYVWRDICSADAFYQGILGLSIRSPSRKGFTNITQGFDPSHIETEYFGVTTNDWENKDTVIPLMEVNGGLMSDAGELSSILEHEPLTAFIQERKDAVYRYLDNLNQTVQGRRYAP